MDALTTLFTQYSLPSIIILIVLILVVIKFISELISWFYDKIKNYIFKETNKQTHEKTQDERLENHFQDADDHYKEMNRRFDEVDEQILVTHKNQEKMSKRLDFIDERLQENTRSYLIDAHHKFCYEIGTIDDYNLQAIERRYMYYKTAGGNSFIDNLVAEIRALPHAHLPDTKIYEDSQELVIEPTGKEVL